MLSLEKCKEVLNSGKEKFTDEEIVKIRELLCKMANINISKKTKIDGKFKG